MTASGTVSGTSYQIDSFGFNEQSVHNLPQDQRLNNWPVVYVLSALPKDGSERGTIYLGETGNFAARMRQHLKVGEKAQQLEAMRVVLDDEFNKSVCLDLESHLIRYAAGDGTNDVLNRNTGIFDADYYNRQNYQAMFDDIFEDLLAAGVFTRSIPEIVNSALFKLSPFKALNSDQAAAVVDIVEGLIDDLSNKVSQGNLMIVNGDPGTGKTVVAVFLMKLLRDIGASRDLDEADAESMFSEFFVEDTREVLAGLRIGMVVPQQSLRKSLTAVFDNTPGLRGEMVMSPWDVANDPKGFDVLVVDEAHRLNQFSNQSSGMRNKEFAEINERLFASQKTQANQLDWLRAKSAHVILMLDQKQSVRPQDIPQDEFAEIIAGEGGQVPKKYPLFTQMRSLGGNDYIDYVYRVLSYDPPDPEQAPLNFGQDYEIGVVDSPRRLVELINEREDKYTLSRLLAGYAWPWKSKKNSSAIDIDLGEGVKRQWNRQIVDWVDSPNSINEIGSIHTIQGYDLNYAGVIIGEDLRYDPIEKTLYISKQDYHDGKGKENNARRSRPTTPELLFDFITSIYAVLMTRGIHGTFIYAVDPGLREYLRQYFGTIR